MVGVEKGGDSSRGDGIEVPKTAPSRLLLRAPGETFRSTSTAHHRVVKYVATNNELGPNVEPRTSPPQRAEQSGGEFARANPGAREGDTSPQVGSPPIAAGLGARSGGQPAYPMPLNHERATNTGCVRPGFRGSTKGDVRPDAGTHRRITSPGITPRASSMIVSRQVAAQGTKAPGPAHEPRVPLWSMCDPTLGAPEILHYDRRYFKFKSQMTSIHAYRVSFVVPAGRQG